MQIETATLLALIAAPMAVLAVVTAVISWLIVRRGRKHADRATAILMSREDVLRGDLVGARASLARLRASVAMTRSAGQRIDGGALAWTSDLATQRASLERLNRSRLGPTVRAVQLAGALSRVALLWRTPTR